MERVIKFRAYDKERKMYVPQGEIIFSDYGETRMEVNPNCLEYVYQSIRQEDFVIEQFTGLVDKSGKEIYEGDRFKTDIGTVYEVLWSNEAFQFTCENQSDKYCYNLWQFKPENIEIIGTIHDTPELLNH